VKNQPQANAKMTKQQVMKDLLAEMESMKGQLQARPGVYLTVSDFTAMENQIAVQETQLADCEAALCKRTEELRLLRIDEKEKSDELKLIKSERDEQIKKFVEEKNITIRGLEVEWNSLNHELFFELVEMKNSKKLLLNSNVQT
jgi:hypothetical protein